MCFFVNNVEFLRTPILKSNSDRLLLQRESWNFFKIIEVIETLFEIDDALDRLFVSDDLEMKNLPRKLLGLFYKLRKSSNYTFYTSFNKQGVIKSRSDLEDR